jgi:hypothetical protein
MGVLCQRPLGPVLLSMVIKQEGQRSFGSTHSFIHYTSKVNTKAVSCVHRIRYITLFSNSPSQKRKKSGQNMVPTIYDCLRITSQILDTFLNKMTKIAQCRLEGRLTFVHSNKACVTVLNAYLQQFCHYEILAKSRWWLAAILTLITTMMYLELMVFPSSTK